MSAGNESLHSSRPLAAAKRMRLSKPGEIRALAGIAKQGPQPGEQVFWRKFGRSFTLVELADIEIIEPSVQIENDATINLDEDISRALYALCWERFEKTLVEINALYNEQPSEGQEFAFNRVKRILWETDDLKKYATALFTMTALPDSVVEEDAYAPPEPDA